MTSDKSSSNGSSPDSAAELADAWGAVAQSFLDSNTLQRMANEFFRDQAGSEELARADALARDILADPTIFSARLPLSEDAPALPNLGLADANALYLEASSAFGAVSPPQLSGGSPLQSSGLPGIPGGLNPESWATEAAFGWLAEARSLFGTAPWPEEQFLASYSAQTIGDRKLDLGVPQIPGAVIPAADPALALGFLGDVRSLADYWDQLERAATTLPGLPQTPVPASPNALDVEAIRRDFPILQERVNGRPLVWLDNAATTQKPRQVIDRLSYFYEHENSNIHRAAHTLAARATDAYEAARGAVRRFLNAASSEEIIFVRGATEAINLVAASWGHANIREGDEILITWLEHHANIVPWQMLATEKGARLRVAPVDDSGQVILSEYAKLLTPRTRLVAIAHVSNALGTVTPVQEMAALAHRAGARVLVDGAQAVSHMPVDVQALGADFYVFSGHKVFGPTGIGVVYGRSDVLQATPPWQGGGNMIADVTFERTIYQPPPTRFEAGTGNIADAVGLGAALDYVQGLGMANIARYEHDLLLYATDALQRIPGLRLIGTAADKAGVLSFVLDGFKTEDVGAALSREGIAVRAGHHCAQPILRRFGVESTVRPSLALYNDCHDIDALVAALWSLKTGRIAGPL